ncbi:MAG: glycoside hydrolase family 57 protein [bacterium]|nr:glycoside hydrolase family 57 protein [bacterium]
MAGAFTFVLHSHLPWVRRAGRWPFGEEWVHQALLDVYLPLLEAIEGLAREGIRGGITLGVTPVLLEQLCDRHLCTAFDAYLDERIALTRGDLDPRADALDGARRTLAQHYLTELTERRERWRHHWQRDVVGALRAFAQTGTIEVITSAATHAYLPLLATDSALDAELQVGIAATQRLLGVEPRGIWLPECAYRGAYEPAGAPGYRPALDAWLAARGIRYFFVDAHALSGISRGPGAWSATLAVEATAPVADAEAAAAAQSDEATLLPHLLPSGVAAFARDARVSRQVWSRDQGYPGDGAYREFHKRDERSGNQYWRVTGPQVALGAKGLYDPREAQERARAHGAHFAELVERLLGEFARGGGGAGIVAAPFDAELFGHWWAEGPCWLSEVLRCIHQRGAVALTTPSEYLDRHGAPAIGALRESSWGEAGDNRVWYNQDVGWMWPVIHRCEYAMQRIAARAYAAPREREMAAQAGRELLLLASSDWPFLVTTGQARDYAVERFNVHVARFDALSSALDGAGAQTQLIEESFHDDTLFPDLEPGLFRERPLQPLPASPLPLTQPLIARLRVGVS